MLSDTVRIILIRFSELRIEYKLVCTFPKQTGIFANDWNYPPEIKISCRASTFIFHFAGRLAHTAIFISVHRRIIGLIL
jgi:hypothetical protein